MNVQPTRSLRGRLLLLLLAATAVVWVMATAVAYLEAKATYDRLFDDQLESLGEELALTSGHEIFEELAFRELQGKAHIEPNIVPAAAQDEDHWPRAVQVWVLGDRLVLRSENAPSEPMIDLTDGFANVTIDGVAWRAHSVSAEEGRLRVIVADQLDHRSMLNAQVALNMVWPQLLAMPLLALLIWLAVGRGLRPLSVLARSVALRDARHLEPVNETMAPQETRPLVQAINQLLGRMGRALDNERRFTADASHELRTPLAALKAQVQVAQRATQEIDRRRAISQINTGVDRATRLVQQLLTLARLDPDSALGQLDAVDLTECAGSAVADLVPTALAKGIELELEAPDGCYILGSRDALEVLIRNLVENGLRYTPAPGHVHIRVVEGMQPRLEVLDSGKGIPARLREQVFQRFFRGDHPSTSEGSGLGLSIVKRIAHLHGATVELGDSPLGGLMVSVCFAASLPAPSGDCPVRQTG